MAPSVKCCPGVLYSHRTAWIGCQVEVCDEKNKWNAAEAPLTQQQQPLPADRMAVDEEVDRKEDLEEEQAGEDRDDAVLDV